MTVRQQIKAYINSHPEFKKKDLDFLHAFILKIMPSCKLRYLDGRNADGKIVTNPNIGYGEYTIQYADGKTKEFYQIGLSANTSGISIYIMGLDDKTYLLNTFGKTIGKASVTGYCIKFKAVKDINLTTLEEAIRYGLAASNSN